MHVVPAAVPAACENDPPTPVWLTPHEPVPELAWHTAQSRPSPCFTPFALVTKSKGEPRNVGLVHVAVDVGRSPSWQGRHVDGFASPRRWRRPSSKAV